MPEFLERALGKEADKKGFSGKQKDRYIWGGMNNIGAVKGSKITSKGRSMERKHEAKISGK